MKLKILSDLHIEVCEYKDIFPNEPAILILAGDTGQLRNETSYVEFLNELSFFYDYVLCIFGNHEYYYNGIHYNIGALEKRLNSNVKILENKTFIYMNYKFIGTTLWTDFNNNDFLAKTVAKQSMNDFYLISEKDGSRRLQPETLYDIFVKDIDFIEKEIDPAYKNIIISHHAPSVKSISKKYLTSANKYLNYAYYSDLEKFIFANEDNIKYWIHGHTHDSSDYNIGKARIVANPRGYAAFRNNVFVTENKKFKENLLLDLD
jgi:predicted phosphodiesterase